MLRIKGFDKDLKCKGMQFEVGKEYKIDSSKLELCTDTVFHYCKTLKQVHAFYPVNENNRYCYIEVLGEEIEDDGKCGSDHIKIVSEILGEELDTLIGRVNGNTGIFNIGKSNTGYCNTGNRNTGDFNTCNFSNGIFCAEEPKINIFNKQSKYTMREFMKTKYYRALYSTPINLIKEQKGRAVAVDFKTACANWWEKMSEENKKIIKSIPNFDAEIFEEITGIKEDK